MTLTDVELAVAAAQAGAEVVRGAYGVPSARFDKSATDFATQADLDAERAILDLLGRERPGDALLGEESGSSGAAAAQRTWLVDPLCGTLNFAAQTPLMAVNVALKQGDEVAVAASADPCAGEVFWTDGGAVWARRDGTDERVRPSTDSRLVDVNIDHGLVAPGDDLAVLLLADRPFRSAFGPRVLSSTLPLAWVAAGRRAAYVTGGDLRDSVHFAAGIALCRAAGCIVTGVLGQPLHTGAGGLVAAADERTHRLLVEGIRRVVAAGRPPG